MKRNIHNVPHELICACNRNEDKIASKTKKLFRVSSEKLTSFTCWFYETDHYVKLYVYSNKYDDFLVYCELPTVKLKLKFLSMCRALKKPNLQY